MEEVNSKRRYDLDWLRVLATLAVLVYHCLMFFNPWPWHVKNNDLDSNVVVSLSLLIGSWLMPLFFVISGISVSYALRKRTIYEYVKERWFRLGIPLVFGVFVLSPPQVYIERITHDQFSGSFFTFLPHYFDGLYLEIGGTGNFAFVGLHLWYLFVLLIFTVVTLPILKFQWPLHLLTRINGKFMELVMVLLLIVLVSLVEVINLGGWDLFFYLMLFLYGYFIFSNETFQYQQRKNIKFYTLTAGISSILFFIWYLNGEIPTEGWTKWLFNVIRVVNCWSWLAVIFFIGIKFFSKSNRILRYCAEASMPFYVIHQPIIVLIGFYIKNLNISIPIKYFMLISISFIIITSIYHFLIKPFRYTRFLHGIGDRKVIKVNT